MADWKDRLLGDANRITLTSPSGIEFIPFWNGKTSVSGEKKIGEFSYPGFNGSEIQDLQSKARKYPLTLWFVGSNNDIEAKNFTNALNDEVGPWEIDNPAWGILSLQLVSFNGQIDLIENGNIAVVTTQWTRVTLSSSQISQVETLENVDTQLNILNDTASNQYFNSIIEGIGTLERKAASLRQSLTSSINDSVVVIDRLLSPLAQLDGNIFNRYTSILNSIGQTLESNVFESLIISGQIQLLIQLPGETEGSTTTNKINRFTNLLNSFISSIPTTATDENINVALSIELSAGAIIGALSNIAVSGEYKTRVQALNVASSLLQAFSDTTNALESIQELYNNNPVYLQYKAQSQTFSDIRQLISLSVRYLLELSENLKTEKIIKIVNQRTPITLAAKYYNSVDEESIDLILDANELKGFERILLDIGREIIIYI